MAPDARRRGDPASAGLGDVTNQKAAGGILRTLEKPTKPMRDEAVHAGRYESKPWEDYPRIQLLPIEGLLSGNQRVNSPPLPGTIGEEFGVGIRWVEAWTLRREAVFRLRQSLPLRQISLNPATAPSFS